MRMHSSSTRHYADGGVGEVFESTKHFWSVALEVAKLVDVVYPRVRECTS